MKKSMTVQEELMTFMLCFLEQHKQKEPERLNMPESVKRLLVLGFSSSTEVESYQKKLMVNHAAFEDFIEKEKKLNSFVYILKEARRYYKDALLIPYNQFEKVVEKHDLVCGQFKDFVGEIPSSIIGDIEASLYAIENMKGIVNELEPWWAAPISPRFSNIVGGYSRLGITDRSERKVALRLGTIKDNHNWQIRSSVVKELFRGEKTLNDVLEEDVYPDFKQKGIDMKIGVDIASLAFKRLVDTIVLFSGDSDFVPASKLARREGIDFILDPMQANVEPQLFEHIDGLKNASPFNIRKAR